ncbi:hypothetical protein [Actinobacillus vicugnae]|uniref:hypothetical protein n=1 Tax=Actinobacillus vicugnae TaxID=2573093 RepID=UPI00123F9A8F|nr:hypothetical protein [Actinobacillus vicugnae]
MFLFTISPPDTNTQGEILDFADYTILSSTSQKQKIDSNKIVSAKQSNILGSENNGTLNGADLVSINVYFNPLDKHQKLALA